MKKNSTKNYKNDDGNIAEGENILKSDNNV